MTISKEQLDQLECTLFGVYGVADAEILTVAMDASHAKLLIAEVRRLHEREPEFTPMTPAQIRARKSHEVEHLRTLLRRAESDLALFDLGNPAEFDTRLETDEPEPTKGEQ